MTEPTHEILGTEVPAAELRALVEHEAAKPRDERSARMRTKAPSAASASEDTPSASTASVASTSTTMDAPRTGVSKRKKTDGKTPPEGKEKANSDPTSESKQSANVEHSMNSANVADDAPRGSQTGIENEPKMEFATEAPAVPSSSPLPGDPNGPEPSRELFPRVPFGQRRVVQLAKNDAARASLVDAFERMELEHAAREAGAEISADPNTASSAHPESVKPEPSSRTKNAKSGAGEKETRSSNPAKKQAKAGTQTDKSAARSAAKPSAKKTSKGSEGSNASKAKSGEASPTAKSSGSAQAGHPAHPGRPGACASDADSGSAMAAFSEIPEPSEPERRTEFSMRNIRTSDDCRETNTPIGASAAFDASDALNEDANENAVVPSSSSAPTGKGGRYSAARATAIGSALSKAISAADEADAKAAGVQTGTAQEQAKVAASTTSGRPADAPLAFERLENASSVRGTRSSRLKAEPAKPAVVERIALPDIDLDVDQGELFARFRAERDHRLAMERELERRMAEAERLVNASLYGEAPVVETPLPPRLPELSALEEVRRDLRGERLRDENGIPLPETTDARRMQEAAPAGTDAPSPLSPTNGAAGPQTPPSREPLPTKRSSSAPTAPPLQSAPALARPVLGLILAAAAAAAGAIAAIAWEHAGAVPTPVFAVVDRPLIEERIALLRIAYARPGMPERPELARLNAAAIADAIELSAEDAGVLALDRTAFIGIGGNAPLYDLTADVMKRLGINEVDAQALERSVKKHWFLSNEEKLRIRENERAAAGVRAADREARVDAALRSAAGCETLRASDISPAETDLEAVTKPPRGSEASFSEIAKETFEEIAAEVKTKVENLTQLPDILGDPASPIGRIFGSERHSTYAAPSLETLEELEGEKRERGIAPIPNLNRRETAS